MAKPVYVGTYEINGKSLQCPHCEGTQFWTRSTLMNTKGVTFFGLEWTNKEATNYVCNQCGHVLWFLEKS